MPKISFLLLSLYYIKTKNLSKNKILIISFNYKFYQILKTYTILFLIFFLDISNQANLHLVNLKEIIEKLQSDNFYFQTKVESLQIENKQLTKSNRNLFNEVNNLKEKLKTKKVV